MKKREEIRKLQEKLDEEKENLAKAESIVEEIEQGRAMLDAAEATAETAVEEFRRLFIQPKKEPSKLSVDMLLKKTRQQRRCESDAESTITLADSEGNPVASKKMEKLKKKKIEDEEKKKEKAEPTPKSVPDVLKRGSGAGSSKDHLKQKPAEPAGPPPERKPRTESYKWEDKERKEDRRWEEKGKYDPWTRPRSCRLPGNVSGSTAGLW